MSIYRNDIIITVHESINETHYKLHDWLHRADGPAVTWTEDGGGGTWWLFGRNHRYYGPCVSHEWWIHGGFIK